MDTLSQSTHQAGSCAVSQPIEKFFTSAASRHAVLDKYDISKK